MVIFAIHQVSDHTLEQRLLWDGKGRRGRKRWRREGRGRGNGGLLLEHFCIPHMLPVQLHWCWTSCGLEWGCHHCPKWSMHCALSCYWRMTQSPHWGLVRVTSVAQCDEYGSSCSTSCSSKLICSIQLAALQLPLGRDPLYQLGVRVAFCSFTFLNYVKDLP